MSRAVSALTIALVACAGPDAGPDTSTTIAELQCFHTETAITCKQNTGSFEDRTKVEDFYPSACFDGDADLDGTPDFIDFDFLGSAEAEADVARDELRCPRCNRGPGTQNDFRLRVEGDAGELDRGKVYLRDGDRLSVPTPDGVLEIALTPATEIEDGEPVPGAEIRVEGTIANGVLQATRLKVLCPGPAAMPPGETPPDTEEPQPDPSGPVVL